MVSRDFTLVETGTQVPTAWLGMGAEAQLTDEGPCQDTNPPLIAHKNYPLITATTTTDLGAEPFPLGLQACATLRIPGRKRFGQLVS